MDMLVRFIKVLIFVSIVALCFFFTLQTIKLIESCKKLTVITKQVENINVEYEQLKEQYINDIQENIILELK